MAARARARRSRILESLSDRLLWLAALPEKLAFHSFLGRLQRTPAGTMLRADRRVPEPANAGTMACSGSVRDRKPRGIDMTGSTAWLELGRGDFLEALACLRPRRVSKTHLLKELQIGLVRGEAVFSMEGVESRQPARGQWGGIACMSYGMLYRFLRYPPETDAVRLVYDGRKLQLGNSRFDAMWVGASELAGDALLNAHVMATEDTRRWRCPGCELKQARRLDGLPSRVRMTPGLRLLISIRDGTEATHACPNCGYAWKEVSVNVLAG